MANKLIIGISGTNGSGKDTVGEMLAQHFGFRFISVTDALRAECVKRGWSTEREFNRRISIEWREQFGLGVLVDRAVETYNQAGGDFKGLVMASLRNPFEADRIHELGGIMVWVDADAKIRYDRIINSNRVRGVEDDKTFEQFLADEKAEMHAPTGSGDSALNMASVKAKADFTVFNDGTAEELKQKLAELVKA